MRTSRNTNLDLCKQIHKHAVTKTEFQKVETRYSNLSSFLAEYLKSTVLQNYFSDSNQDFIKILVMGSYALKNATKKVRDSKSERFNDLDLKIIFSHHFKDADPSLLVKTIKMALKIYAERFHLQIEDNERCTHLHYADITIDISVGVRESNEGHLLKIPVYDELLKQYRYETGKPETFIDYFNSLAESERFNLSEMLVKNASVDVDELEFQDGFLGSLRYASMLLKSHKSRFFIDDPESEKSVKGILLSALCANLFTQGLTVIEIIDAAINFLDINARYPGRELRIPDPVDPNENYASYLNEDIGKKELFLSWLNDLKIRWSLLKQAEKNAYIDEALKAFFDPESVDFIFNSIGKKVSAAVAAGGVFMDTNGNFSNSKSPQGTLVTPTKYWGNSLESESKHFALGQDLILHKLSRDMEENIKCLAEVKVPSHAIEWMGHLKSPLTGFAHKVHIKYHPSWSFPRVFVDGVKLNSPHIHPTLNGCLCLFKPSASKWNSSKPFSQTIVPWTVEWIVQWEIWKITGKFNGQEEKH